MSASTHAEPPITPIYTHPQPPGDPIGDPHEPTETPTQSLLDRTHNSLVEHAVAEVEVPPSRLFWSGVGAGLVISLSFLAAAGARAAAPDAWAPLAGAVAYPLGFAAVILGRYQLFTENTLPPVALVLERLRSVPSLLALWGIVLLGNAVGASIAGAVLSWPELLPAEVTAEAAHVASVLHPLPPDAVFGRAVVAGWLVATMVWLLHGPARNNRLAIIWACVTLMPLLHLEHVVVGGVEAGWAVAGGAMAFSDALVRLGITLVGNTLGGVLLVALLNHARTAPADNPVERRLGLRDWLLGERRGLPQEDPAC